jgi:AraC-like DNA-binding protein
VINDVRRDLVLRYLDNPNYSLSSIANMLGYSMASSFTRWFITQFGMPPATRHSVKKRYLPLNALRSIELVRTGRIFGHSSDDGEANVMARSLRENQFCNR